MRRTLKSDFFHDNQGKRRPGLETLRINTKVATENPADQDRKNRDLVVSKIIELVDKGISLEDACKTVSEDEELTSKFSYLPKNSLATIFANWCRGRLRIRKGIEKYDVKRCTDKGTR